LATSCGIVADIYNDAWRATWGFVPVTEAELQRNGAELKAFVRERGCMIAEWDGAPAGFITTVPDVNKAIQDLDGRLLPFG
jgi:hypothetical protein